MVVLDPVSPVVLETKLINLRFTVYGLDEATEICLLETVGGQHVEVMCTIPDVRPTVSAFASKSSVYPMSSTAKHANAGDLAQLGQKRDIWLTFVIFLSPFQLSQLNEGDINFGADALTESGSNEIVITGHAMERAKTLPVVPMSPTHSRVHCSAIKVNCVRIPY